MSGNAFLVGHKRDYFYASEPQCIWPYRFNDWIKRVGVALYYGLDIKKALPGFFIKNEVFSSNKIIITDNGFSPFLLEALKKRIKSENIFLYYMNLISPKKVRFMRHFSSGQIYSFDRDDAQRYNIRYKHLPYSGKMTLEQDDPEYDALFIGIEKNRLSEVEEATNIFERYGLKPKVMLWQCDDPQYKMRHYISYVEYLKYLSKSKTIMEITIQGQSSCTFRFLESLFFHKKLVTNNIHIVDDPYYDSANVFLLGVDDPCTLPYFVAKPYKETHCDLDKLLFENWIEDW